MSKFNKSSLGSTVVENYMGGKSFKQSEKEELVFSVVTSFIEDSYYESKDERIGRIKKLVESVARHDPLFVAKLAIITRREFHMRSAFHVLVGSLSQFHKGSKSGKGDSIVKNTIIQGVERPDDLTEIAAFVGGKKMSHQVEKGIKEAIKKFSRHQIAKYKGEGKDVSLVDLFNLTHPDGDKPEWKDLINGKLKSEDTWEAKLSGGEKHEKVWKDLLKSGKIGYMAVLRNLRNIVDKTDSETVNLAIKFITDKESVKKSKQLPFRFLSALKALEEYGDTGLSFEKEGGKVNDVRDAVIKALTYSVDNIPLLSGRTVILSDNSGSMRGDGGGSSLASRLSDRKTSDIANLFAVLYWLRADNTLIGLFGDRLIMPKLDRSKNVYDNFKKIDSEALQCGGSTETGIFTMFEKLIDEKKVVDRIVIFSDSQVGTDCKWYDSGSRRGDDFNALFNRYRKINPDVKVYDVDLKGYGNKLFHDGVFILAGWSDKIFELMEVIEKKEGLVKFVENYPVQL